MKLSCTRCGASVVFVPSTGKCHCNHCGEDIDPEEYTDLNEKIQYQECTCSSCGAKLVVEESTKISMCAYCGSKFFHLRDYKGDIKVDGIIPFEIDRESFQKKADDFIVSQKLSPQKFRFTLPISDIKGVYLLSKEYKVNTTAYARGTYNDSLHFFEFRYDVKNTYLSDNSKAFDDKVFEEIGPYPTEDLKKFSPFYLTDFSIDQGNEEEKLVLNRIARNEGKFISDDLHEKLFHYKSICQKDGIQASHTALEETRNILIPVWFFTVEYEGENYVYAMNGKTGKIYGGLSGRQRITAEDEIMRFRSVLGALIMYALILSFWVPYIALLGFAIIFVVCLGLSIYIPVRRVIALKKKDDKAPLSKWKLLGIILFIFGFLAFVVKMMHFSWGTYFILIFAVSLILNIYLKFGRKKNREIYMNTQTRIADHIIYQSISSAAEYSRRFSPHELASFISRIGLTDAEFKELVKNNGVGITFES